jgi:hypothetical protein
MSAPGSMLFSTPLPFDGGSLACSPDGACNDGTVQVFAGRP